MDGIFGTLNTHNNILVTREILEGYYIVEHGVLRKHDMVWSVLNQKFLPIKGAPSQEHHTIEKFTMVLRKELSNNPLKHVIKAGMI